MAFPHKLLDGTGIRCFGGPCKDANEGVPFSACSYKIASPLRVWISISATYEISDNGKGQD